MNKTFKILLVTFLFVFVIFTGKCFAVNIDMNLASNLADSNTNIANDNEIDNSIIENTVADNSTASDSTNSSSSSFNRLSSLPEAELGLTNILNILLITVGVVLILLAIAILIKLKH